MIHDPWIDNREKMMLRALRMPRPVDINGHHEFALGMFHGWTRDNNGDVKAIIEYEGGGVGYVEPYKLTFRDGPTEG